MNRRKVARELQSIAQAGLKYTRDAYDRGRYGRLWGLAAEIAAERAARPACSPTMTIRACRRVSTDPRGTGRRPA